MLVLLLTLFLSAAAANVFFNFSIDALSDALSEWGEAKGAIIVVSHDRHFCDKITFTHVATVKDGKLILEERGVRPSDWIVAGMAAATDHASSMDAPSGIVRSNDVESSPSSTTQTTPPMNKELDPKLRKAAYNAPKRIKKLEALIAESENKIAELEALMLGDGKNVDKLVDWNKQKQTLQGKIDSYMNEWTELENLLSQVAEMTGA
jgi:ABC transporter C-terminal domain